MTLVSRTMPCDPWDARRRRQQDKMPRSLPIIHHPHMLRKLKRMSQKYELHVAFCQASVICSIPKIVELEVLYNTELYIVTPISRLLIISKLLTNGKIWELHHKLQFLRNGAFSSISNHTWWNQAARRQPDTLAARRRWIHAKNPTNYSPTCQETQLSAKKGIG